MKGEQSHFVKLAAISGEDGEIPIERLA